MSTASTRARTSSEVSLLVARALGRRAKTPLQKLSAHMTQPMKKAWPENKGGGGQAKGERSAAVYDDQAAGSTVGAFPGGSTGWPTVLTLICATAG